MGRPRLVLLRSGRGLLKPFERAENGMDGLGLFGIGKYPVFRRYVLRPVVMLLEARRGRRHISAGSEPPGANTPPSLIRISRPYAS